MKFDLAGEVKRDAPRAYRKPSVFDHPRIAEWLETLVQMRASGTPVTLEYMAAKLTKGARMEKIIGPRDSIKAPNLRRHLAERG